MTAFIDAIKPRQKTREETEQERLEENRKQYNSSHRQNKLFRKQKKRTAMAKASRRINRK